MRRVDFLYRLSSNQGVGRWTAGNTKRPGRVLSPPSPSAGTAARRCAGSMRQSVRTNAFARTAWDRPRACCLTAGRSAARPAATLSPSPSPCTELSNVGVNLQPLGQSPQPRRADPTGAPLLMSGGHERRPLDPRRWPAAGMPGLLGRDDIAASVHELNVVLTNY